jgi:cell division protein FtsI (penicillin-binding protein 3)
MTNEQLSSSSRISRFAIEGQKGAIRKDTRARLRIVMFGALAVYAVMGVRLYDVSMQVDHKEPLIERRLAEQSTAPLPRADITDRNGILLATSLPVSSLYADPSMIKDPAKTARDLAPILGIKNTKELKKDLSKKGRFVWLKRGITPAQHKQINALGYPGLAFQRETRRFYPHGHLFAHMIGATNIDGKGIAGLEYQKNNELAKGLNELQTSLDVRLQYSAYKALNRSIDKFSAIGGAAIIADVKTGEILAAISAPDFEPLNFGNASSNKTFNRLTQGVYEMGSTFKIFSTAAYLREHGNSVADEFDAQKPLRVGRFTIRDYHPEKRIMSVADIFLHSSNIGTALMAKDIGGQKLRQAFREIGLMNAIKYDDIKTASPLLPSVWREANTLTSSYGHGIAVSPMHLMQAFISTIGDGTVKKITFLRRPHTSKTEISTRFLDSKTADMMPRLLRLGVTHGTGQFADLKGYQIGGKTGTAEKIGHRGGYNEDRLISSFIGAFPMHDPQYAILVMVDEPKPRKDTYGYATGGWVAAPAVREIVADMARILSLPPLENAKQADEELTKPFMPYVEDKEPKNTAAILRRGRDDITLPRFVDFKKEEAAQDD